MFFCIGKLGDFFFLNIYNDVVAGDDKKAKLSERALELLALPDDGLPRLLLDIGKLSLSLSLSVQVCVLNTSGFQGLMIDCLNWEKMGTESRVHLFWWYFEKNANQVIRLFH